jgi:tetratricopeptide (TPR) repeat protein
MQRALSYVSVILVVLFLFLPANAAEEGGGAYYDLGVFAYEEGDYEIAEGHFKKALGFNPDDPFFNHFLGKTYLKTGRYQEAMHYLNIAWKVDPDISELKSDLAFLNLKMSNYSKAADLFMQIVTEDPSNVLAHYHAGMSLYRQKHYGRALDYFLAAAQRSPTVKTNSYYYAGVCYFETGKAEKAVEKFEYVRDHADSGPLRENSIVWLERIRTEKKDHKPYSLYLKVGYHYDDNVPLEPLDDDFYADEDDYVTKVFFSGKYNFVDSKSYNIGAGYSHYQTWHNDLVQYDLIGSIGNVYAKYRLQPFTFGLSYIPSYYWLDSENYLRRHKLNPEVVWKCTEKFATKLSYSYYDDENFLNDDRDGEIHEGFLDVYYSIMGKKAYLFGGIGYDDKSASHPDQDYGRLKTKLGISLTIPWELNLRLTGKYQEKTYDNVDTVYGVEREDTKYHGSISLSRKLFYDWLGILAEFNYTKNDSNINDLEYERKVTGLSLTARY